VPLTMTWRVLCTVMESPATNGRERNCNSSAWTDRPADYKAIHHSATRWNLTTFWQHWVFLGQQHHLHVRNSLLVFRYRTLKRMCSNSCAKSHNL
jgi:hypothetical protein